MENYFNSMDDLDISCLYEEKDLYEYFYAENVKQIYIQFFYVSKKEIIYKKKINYCLKNENELTREEINKLYSSFNNYNSHSYKLNKILKYNFSLKQKEIHPFLKAKNISLLKSIEHNENIYFEPTITFFQELNEIFFILQKEESKHNNTKKVYINKIKYLG
jgi:hypothetical protein